MFGLPVDLRSLAARRARRTGPKVSGKKKRGTKEAPANIKPIQNTQRHPRVGAINPDIRGAASGPMQVPYKAIS